ncbi:hypothetical protein ANANG_G00184730 [Anguilla anguilla]|uniref:Uncharacterized protein n=1 Tax=Anguilla anguilla TaxID=7936 RepID=A0A9D3M774_ANGAN|nr:hypothetical protein ANANG_G00184730 [Anguilla anguilla]
MSFLFCCRSSCLSTVDESAESSAERQPILPAESARQSRPPAQAVAKQKGKILTKLVGVSELDQHFADIRDMFNQQQGHYETMTKTLQALRGSYGCSNGNSFSECLKRIMEEHCAAEVRLQVRGFELTLAVSGELSDRLQRTQEQVRSLGQAATAVVAAGPKLKNMTGWVLQEEAQQAERVREASASHQERRRLEANLRENLQDVRRVGELSASYRVEADAFLKEAIALAHTLSTEDSTPAP